MKILLAGEDSATRRFFDQHFFDWGHEVVHADNGTRAREILLGDEEIASKVDDVIYVPDLGEFLTAIVVAIPMQLFAYHVATRKGTDVDQPRNLAKCVTVE